MHIVGFTIRIYYDARSSERQVLYNPQDIYITISVRYPHTHTHTHTQTQVPFSAEDYLSHLQ